MEDMPIGTTAPLPEAIAEYLAACEAEGQSRATLGWKRAVLRRFAHYADSVAAEDVGDLTLELARRWQRHLRTTPMAHPRRKPGHEGERRAAHTVNGYCRVLRAFAGWLAEAGYVDAHPLEKFRPGRLPAREVEPIAADDQQRLLDACDPRSPLGLRDLAILSVLLDTGLRSSELCRLRVADLDLASGEVRVRGGKGARDRTVALGQRARSMVDRYLQLARPWPDDPDPDADRVFLTRQRRPFTRYTLGRVLKRLAGRAKLANIHPHRFRHTFGVTYLRAGGDVLTLQRILGHTTLVMVNHYLHLSSSDVVDRHRAHSPLDRLPNGRTFRRAARTGRRATSARIVAVKGGQLVLRTDNGDLLEIAT